MPLPDLTAGASASPLPDGIDGSSAYKARICNRGAAPVGAGVMGTFYTAKRGEPGARRICSVYTNTVLQPGTCEDAWCTPEDPALQGLSQWWFYANDRGNGKPGRRECKEGNNLYSPVLLGSPTG